MEMLGAYQQQGTYSLLFNLIYLEGLKLEKVLFGKVQKLQVQFSNLASQLTWASISMITGNLGNSKLLITERKAI